MHDLADHAACPVQRRLMEYVRLRFQEDEYAVTKLLGDASARQYFRLSFPHGQSLILAAYPEPFDPDDFPYRSAYDLLSGIGLRLPEILHMDGRRGIVLQQDLGDVTLQRKLLKARPREGRRFFEEAVEFIVRMQVEGTPAVAPDSYPTRMAFDTERFEWELRFFHRHYLVEYRGQSTPDNLDKEYQALSRELSREPRVLCHRDLHVRNLMVHDDDLYIIDFQDARLGPESYDLVSLLKDSVQLPSDQIESLIAIYRQGSASVRSNAEFLHEFDLMSVQRLLKALGTYAYQIGQRANFIYEQYMPGTLKRALDSARRLSGYPAIRTLLEQECRCFPVHERHPASIS